MFLGLFGDFEVGWYMLMLWSSWFGHWFFPWLNISLAPVASSLENHRMHKPASNPTRPQLAAHHSSHLRRSITTSDQMTHGLNMFSKNMVIQWVFGCPSKQSDQVFGRFWCDCCVFALLFRNPSAGAMASPWEPAPVPSEPNTMSLEELLLDGIWRSHGGMKNFIIKPFQLAPANGFNRNQLIFHTTLSVNRDHPMFFSLKRSPDFLNCLDRGTVRVCWWPLTWCSSLARPWWLRSSGAICAAKWNPKPKAKKFG